MNEIVRSSRFTRTTQAAEGQLRWRWSTAELLRLRELGAFTPEDRFEVIGGEIVPVSPVGRRHELVGETIELKWRGCDPNAIVIAERQFNLSDDTYTKPDLLVRPPNLLSYDARGGDALLIVEVSDTTLDYDLGTKAGIYARHGVREYWVIEAWTLATTVHLEPRPEGYARVRRVAAADLLTPTLAPALAIRLADLGL